MASVCPKPESLIQLGILADLTLLNKLSFDIHFAIVIETFAVALLVNAPSCQEICTDAYRDYGSWRDRQRRWRTVV